MGAASEFDLGFRVQFGVSIRFHSSLGLQTSKPKPKTLNRGPSTLNPKPLDPRKPALNPTLANVSARVLVFCSSDMPGYMGIGKENGNYYNI